MNVLNTYTCYLSNKCKIAFFFQCALLHGYICHINMLTIIQIYFFLRLNSHFSTDKWTQCEMFQPPLFLLPPFAPPPIPRSIAYSPPCIIIKFILQKTPKFFFKRTFLTAHKACLKFECKYERYGLLSIQYLNLNFLDILFLVLNNQRIDHPPKSVSQIRSFQKCCIEIRKFCGLSEIFGGLSEGFVRQNQGFFVTLVCVTSKMNSAPPLPR